MHKQWMRGAAMFAALLCAASASAEAGSVELRAKAEKRLQM